MYITGSFRHTFYWYFFLIYIYKKQKITCVEWRIKEIKTLVRVVFPIPTPKTIMSTINFKKNKKQQKKSKHETYDLAFALSPHAYIMTETYLAVTYIQPEVYI